MLVNRPTTTAKAYRITGGKPIVGPIRCLGAKNFATKAMVASLLADTPSTLTNVPAIGDISITGEMLESVGATVKREGGNMRIDPTTLSAGRVPNPQSGSNRIPILLLAALLHRFSEVSVPVVGGCNIGSRSVDWHLEAIKKFGGIIEHTSNFLYAKRKQ